MTGAHAIAAAFDRAQDYDRHAVVQRRVAEDLADTIAALPVARHRGNRLRLLEIGCGTGFLTAALARRGLGGEWLVTDIAPAMIERCRQRMAGIPTSARLSFGQLDGQSPALPRIVQFDIICSSLAFQWFADPLGSAVRLRKLLRPDGALAITTLLAGTFVEWRDAHAALGRRSGGRAYPVAAELGKALHRHGAAELSVADYREQHREARAFLRALKSIGAGTPTLGHEPLSPAELRAVMTRFEANGCWCTYRVGSLIWHALDSHRHPLPPSVPHQPAPQPRGAYR